MENVQYVSTAVTQESSKTLPCDRLVLKIKLKKKKSGSANKGVSSVTAELTVRAKV